MCIEGQTTMKKPLQIVFMHQIIKLTPFPKKIMLDPNESLLKL